METITVYRLTITKAQNESELGSRFSLVPYYDFTNTTEGHDDGGTLYVMPEDYSIGQNIYALPAFFDAMGRACELKDIDGQPCVCGPSETIPLEKA
jgi:hypothetical protein